MNKTMIEKVFLLGWEACVEYVDEIKDPLIYAPDRVDDYAKRKLLEVIESLTKEVNKK